MSWIVDHASTFYLLLAIAAAGFVFAWWVTKRTKNLAIAIGIVLGIGLLWLITQWFPSDAMHIEGSVRAMADALMMRKVDDIFKHVSKDFKYKEMTRDQLYQRAKSAIDHHQVREIRITKFHVEKLSRQERKATASFRVSAWGPHSDTPYLFGAEADFVLEGERWLLQTLRFYNPVVNQTEEFDPPGLR